MGYDCTLHLVDERAIERDLVPRLLGKSRKVLAFEKRESGAAALHHARKALETADANEAARAVTELAIQFSSATLPHLDARGLALSSWEYAPKKVRASSPLELGASPEVLFKDVVRSRPELAGSFPTSFDENEMTGVFIPASRIGAARRWMERHLSVLSPGDRLKLEPLERVLAAAEKHRLAYWEATDLDVAQAREELLAPAAPKEVRGRWKMPRPQTRDMICRVGDRVFLRLGDDSLAQIDIGAVPPKIERLPIDYATFVGQLEDLWLAIERRKDARPFRFRLFTHAGELAAPAVEAAPMWSGRALANVAVVGARVFARDEDAAPPTLLRWAGKSFERVPEIRPAKGANGNYVFGAARTGDGADVLVWDGDGYELVKGKLVKTFPLGARARYGGWSSAPTAGGAFHYTLDGHVFVAERGKKPRAVATKTTNVQRLAAGPGESTLLRLGDNRQAWAVALLRDGRVVGLRGKEITHADDDVHGVEWSASAGAFFAFTSEAVVALPASLFGS